MAFKLRSQSEPSPVKQGNYSIETLERHLKEYGEPDAQGNRTRVYQSKNVNPGSNKKQARPVAENMFSRAQTGEDSIGYAGGNTGGWFSSKKQVGSTSVRSTKFNESDNIPTKKEIYKTLRKYGSAEIVDGKVTGKDTHQERTTLTDKQYKQFASLVASKRKKVDEINTEKEAKKVELAQKQQAKNDWVKARVQAKEAEKAKRAQELEANNNQKKTPLKAKQAQKVKHKKNN